MFTEADINYWAVLVSAAVGMVIGALWYSPVLFGNLWIRLSKFSKKDMDEAKKKGMTKSYALSFVALIVMSYVLANFIDYLEAATVMQGMQAAFWIWLGFLATTMLNQVLWEGKSWPLYLLNISHHLAVLIVMASILAFWA